MDLIQEKLKWAENQFWAKQMMDTEQSLPYHNENVWEHTKMVCEYLPNTPEWENCDQDALIFAALFHDCAKYDTSEFEIVHGNKIYHFPKHSIVGEKKARKIMMAEGVDFYLREKVCKLVRHHMKPNNFDKYPVREAVIKLSQEVSIRDLCQLNLSDKSGRNVPRKLNYADGANSFTFESKYLNCYDKPYQFPSDGSRVFHFLNDTSIYWAPFEKDFTVTMMSGLPCTGKTTWASKQNLPIVSLDEIRKNLKIKPSDKNGQGLVAQVAKEMCSVFLRKQQSFIFDATNVTEKNRFKWIRHFILYNAKIKIVYMESTIKEILNRNKGRKSPVPESIINKLFEKLDVPNLTECNEIVYNIGD